MYMLVEDKILPIEINNLYKDLVEGSYQKLNEKEKEVIKDSLIIAYNAHDGQLRKSGEPYIYPVSYTHLTLPTKA